MNDQTLGERRVRTTFNPANNGLVDQIKQESAALIDLLEKVLEKKKYLLSLCEQTAERDARLSSIAIDCFNSIPSAERINSLQTDAEAGCMWAVKAATATT